MNSSLDPERLANAALGAAMAQDPSGGSVQLIVMEYPQGSGEAKSNVEVGRTNSGQCPEMTLKMGDQDVKATLESLPEQVEGADESFLSKFTIIMGDTEQPSYTGIASKGQIAVTVAMSSPDGSLDQTAVQELLAESITAMG